MLTVSSLSRSFEGRVEGEKWSFLRTVCLIILSLLREADIRDSADPDMVSVTDGL